MSELGHVPEYLMRQYVDAVRGQVFAPRLSEWLRTNGPTAPVSAWHGPPLPRFEGGVYNELVVYLENGNITFQTPGYESEPVDFNKRSQVQALIDWLELWKTSLPAH